VIGVIPRAGQQAVVEEFFELFKTPWEYYRPGRSYDVVLASADDLPPLNARVVVICGPERKTTDGGHGIVEVSRQPSDMLVNEGMAIPVYCGLTSFAQPRGQARALAVSTTGIAALQIEAATGPIIRLGYDLFQEAQYLLTQGQPVCHAAVPTLDVHTAMLRDWIVRAGVSLVEVPPVPAGHPFAVCLTHDIDFIGIRNHFLDHTMWGFIYRATLGSLINFARGRLPFTRLLECWGTCLSLPLVFAGLMKDVWEPFEWYLRAEQGLPTTYYLIPFKRRPGDRVPRTNAAHRATAYDVSDIRARVEALSASGAEIGVHGLDGWHDAVKGRAELEQVAAVAPAAEIGVRTHWLLHSPETPRVLEEAGYSYDSTVGYNETVGYRAGTGQVFRPLCAKTLLELPMHIQDGALFYPHRLCLSAEEAERRCASILEHVGRFGGVLTVIWHDRSHAAERFWGAFYTKFLALLRGAKPWFGTGRQVVHWFRSRRAIQFERTHGTGDNAVRLVGIGQAVSPGFRIRVHYPPGSADRGSIDVPWNGVGAVALDEWQDTAQSAQPTAAGAGRRAENPLYRPQFLGSSRS
jgi:hypothetical protein